MVRFGSYFVRYAFMLVMIVFLLPQDNARASSEPYIGEVAAFGMSFCPRGWVEANGQLLEINGNDALFSLLGTMYGGDGQTTFGLPDLRGRAAVGVGTGPGLNPRRQGERRNPDTLKYAPGGITAPADAPYLVLRYCIAVQGVYPSRN